MFYKLDFNYTQIAINLPEPPCAPTPDPPACDPPPPPVLGLGGWGGTYEGDICGADPP